MVGRGHRVSVVTSPVRLSAWEWSHGTAVIVSETAHHCRPVAVDSVRIISRNRNSRKYSPAVKVAQVDVVNVHRQADDAETFHDDDTAQADPVQMIIGSVSSVGRIFNDADSWMYSVTNTQRDLTAQIVTKQQEPRLTDRRQHSPPSYITAQIPSPLPGIKSDDNLVNNARWTKKIFGNVATFSRTSLHAQYFVPLGDTFNDGSSVANIEVQRTRVKPIQQSHDGLAVLSRDTGTGQGSVVAAPGLYPPSPTLLH
ncbi:hypothetical protein CBL_10957 [Carabus blaptoides fortunei]